ncbi:MAG TPA: choice-of-anchor Q domain-containing protein [Solirubrobacterales bacterium]
MGALLVGASAAQAQVRYAATGGSGAACEQAAPCTLKEAVSKAKSNDEVIVTAGTYPVEETIDPEPGQVNVSIHGDFSGPPPRIQVSKATVGLVSIGVGGRVAYFDIVHDSFGGYGALCGKDGVLERLDVETTGEAAIGIYQTSDCVARDSVVRSLGPNSLALMAGSGGEEAKAEGRNLTLIASGAGSKGVLANCIVCFPIGSQELDLRNSIVSGTLTDLETGGSPVAMVVSNSNFDTVTPGSAVTDGGGNQSAAPQFVDAAAGDYREAAGSPTIDAGLADPLLGSVDLAGASRSIGVAPDIGAYEFVPPAGDLQSLALTAKKFRAANIGGAVASAKKKKRRAPVGSTATYALSDRATVAFTVERKLKGRRAGKKCVKQTKANRSKKRCPLFKSVKGSFSLEGIAGANSFRFSGRVNGKALKPGSYRLVGQTGATLARAGFTIVK